MKYKQKVFRLKREVVSPASHGLRACHLPHQARDYFAKCPILHLKQPCHLVVTSVYLYSTGLQREQM